MVKHPSDAPAELEWSVGLKEGGPDFDKLPYLLGVLTGFALAFPIAWLLIMAVKASQGVL